MELDVSKAFRTPATPFPFEAEVTLAPQDVNGERVAFDPTRLSGTYFVADDTVRLEGELATVAHAQCARCLAPASAPVRVAFDETFRKDADEMEDECFRFTGKAVPLDHMALTLVMLNLPMRFVCREDCAGADAWLTNENPKSSCEDGLPTQRPFEALQSLLKKDEEV